MTRVTVRGPSLSQHRQRIKHKRAKLALEAHRNCVINTPVETGTLRGGWTVDAEAGRITNPVEYGQAVNAQTHFVEAALDTTFKK